VNEVDSDMVLLDKTRALGLVVCRGTAITFISPMDGYQEIENPFSLDEE
jgi:U6 snRNA-associated Sm-like protein LSm7